MNKEQFAQLCRKEHVNPVMSEPCWFHPNKPMPHCGYTNMQCDGKRWYVHVFAYTLFKGPIPERHQVDHLCNPKDGTRTNRSCCNPNHLEAVTAKTNCGRAEPASRTHCPKGHEYTPENTIWGTQKTRSGGIKEMRHCRECTNAYFRKIGRTRRADPEYKAQQAEAHKRWRIKNRDLINARQNARNAAKRQAKLDSLSKSSDTSVAGSSRN